MRLSGEIVWLTWDSFRRQVIVQDFIADYHSPWWISYRIRCVVAHQAGAGLAESTSIAAIVSADLSSAISAAAGSTMSLTSIQAALSSSNALTAGTADQSQAIAVVGSTIATIEQQINEQSAMLIASNPPSESLADVGQSYVSKVNCAAALATTVNVSSYVGRIGVNIAGSGV
jgi:hypothetical protein